MEFHTKSDYIRLWNLRAVVIHKSIAIGWMMAIQAKTVIPMFQLNCFVLDKGSIVIMPARGEELVAFHAVVSPPGFNQIQAALLSRGLTT